MGKAKEQKRESLRTIDIQGKPYVMVHDRISHFREQHPDHALISEIIANGDNHVIFKASIVDKDGKVLATGHAMEKAGSTFINKTSHVENAETSAWGRALANFGIGIDESIASADEVANAVKKQAPESRSKPKKAENVPHSETPQKSESGATSGTTGGNKTDIEVIAELWQEAAGKAGDAVADALILECSSFTGKDGKEVQGFESLAKLQERAAGGKIDKWLKNIKHKLQEKTKQGKTIAELAEEAPF